MLGNLPCHVVRSIVQLALTHAVFLFSLPQVLLFCEYVSHGLSLLKATKTKQGSNPSMQRVSGRGGCGG